MLFHNLLERPNDEIRTLGIVDPVAGHEAGVIVQQDLREGRGPVDVALHEVEVPQVIGAHRFEALVAWLAIDLGRPVSRDLPVRRRTEKWGLHACRKLPQAPRSYFRGPSGELNRIAYSTSNAFRLDSPAPISAAKPRIEDASS